MIGVGPELQVADTIFTAELAVLRAHRAVNQLNGAVASALRILDDAELASAKALLTGPEDASLQPVVEHLDRLQTRCDQMASLATELDTHLEIAARETRLAAALLEQLHGPNRGSPAGTLDTRARDGAHQHRGHEPDRGSQRDDALEVAQLRARVAVLGEVIDLARPMAHTAVAHVQRSREACHVVTGPQVVQPQTLERRLRAAGNDLGRADEGARLPEGVVERAASRAQESVDTAVGISQRARERMATQSRPGAGRGTPSVRTAPPRPGDEMPTYTRHAMGSVGVGGQLIRIGCSGPREAPTAPASRHSPAAWTPTSSAGWSARAPGRYSLGGCITSSAILR